MSFLSYCFSRKKLVFSQNDTEIMMSFVSIMDKNVRGHKEERTFLRDAAC
jgi:hypothetical protein